MAVAVIFGLARATFLTLVVVSVLYYLLIGVEEHFARRCGGGEEDANGEHQDSLAALEGEEGSWSADVVVSTRLRLGGSDAV